MRDFVERFGEVQEDSVGGEVLVEGSISGVEEGDEVS